MVMLCRGLGNMESTACTVNETTFSRAALTITTRIPKVFFQGNVWAQPYAHAIMMLHNIPRVHTISW